MSRRPLFLCRCDECGRFWLASCPHGLNPHDRGCVPAGCVCGNESPDTWETLAGTRARRSLIEAVEELKRRPR